MQDYKVIYKQEDGQVAILNPAPCGRTIQEIADKDVPSGIPYWIVDADSIPTDRTHRDLWEIDMNTVGTPSGYGTESNTFPGV